MPDFVKSLSKYMPEAAAPIVSQWIVDTKCRFRVAKSRSSKLGDYRAPFQGQTHQISVNHDLNPYAFLITTVHEFAHLKTWTQYKDRVKPHGKEWKNNFKELMTPFFKLQVLPHDVTMALLQYMDNPAASSCTDLNLYRTLKKHDVVASEFITVESIPTESVFSLKNGRVFQKKEKLRKRFKCMELSTGKYYLIHPIAEVIPVPTP
ncbi:SprT-like domain-containing protein [Sphingobacterium corticibacter]|uniref:SprT domain-containing protein n=1 Tax=Sphingobacterium corticibacter TaxID=2171749 RepID=A0A2T8HLR2_9SPHI|nr:SprT-like domain-containing protein [Sphingobacterium corticibacter]PVH26381.1 sprT domain-containing protein [Sphingobacterium corticibacter]